jgi:hypothetical protein
MSKNNIDIKELSITVYKAYLEILLNERKRVGESLNEWIDEGDLNEEGLKTIELLTQRLESLDNQISSWIFPHNFKKELITEKQD